MIADSLCPLTWVDQAGMLRLRPNTESAITKWWERRRRRKEEEDSPKTSGREEEERRQGSHRVHDILVATNMGM